MKIQKILPVIPKSSWNEEETEQYKALEWIELLTIDWVDSIWPLGPK